MSGFVAERLLCGFYSVRLASGAEARVDLDEGTAELLCGDNDRERWVVLSPERDRARWEEAFALAYAAADAEIAAERAEIGRAA